MARFAILLALTLAACSQAAPLARRQAVDAAQCDLARTQVVEGIAGADAALQQAAVVAADDADLLQVVANSQENLALATQGVQGVAAALELGQAPPQEARDQVEQGLEGALAALGDGLIEGFSSDVANAFQDVKTQLQAALQGGQLVLETCGGADVAAVDAAAADAAALEAAALEAAALEAADADAAAAAKLAALEAAKVDAAAAAAITAPPAAAEVVTVTETVTVVSTVVLDAAAAAATAPPVDIAALLAEKEAAAAAKAAAAADVEDVEDVEEDVEEDEDVAEEDDLAAKLAALQAKAAANAEALAAKPGNAAAAQAKNAAKKAAKAPAKRQLGNLACNIARFQVVRGLASADNDIEDLAEEANAEAAALLETAKAGVDGAQAAVGQIARALLTGQAAPAEARVEVEAGLTSAIDAVTQAAAADAAIAEQAQSILEGLGETAAAGNEVVAECV